MVVFITVYSKNLIKWLPAENICTISKNVCSLCFFHVQKPTLMFCFWPKYINLKTVNGITVLKCYKM